MTFQGSHNYFVERPRPEPVLCLLSVLFYLFPFLFINLFIYFWLHWVFIAVRGLSLVAASGGFYSLLRCAGVAVCGLLIAVASLVAEHRL